MIVICRGVIYCSLAVVAVILMFLKSVNDFYQISLEEDDRLNGTA